MDPVVCKLQCSLARLWLHYDRCAAESWGLATMRLLPSQCDSSAYPAPDGFGRQPGGRCPSMCLAVLPWCSGYGMLDCRLPVVKTTIRTTMGTLPGTEKVPIRCRRDTRTTLEESPGCLGSAWRLQVGCDDLPQPTFGSARSRSQHLNMTTCLSRRLVQLGRDRNT